MVKKLFFTHFYHKMCPIEKAQGEIRTAIDLSMLQFSNSNLSLFFCDNMKKKYWLYYIFCFDKAAHFSYQFFQIKLRHLKKKPILQMAVSVTFVWFFRQYLIRLSLLFWLISYISARIYLYWHLSYRDIVSYICLMIITHQSLQLHDLIWYRLR